MKFEEDAVHVAVVGGVSAHALHQLLLHGRCPARLCHPGDHLLRPQVSGGHRAGQRSVVWLFIDEFRLRSGVSD